MTADFKEVSPDTAGSALIQSFAESLWQGTAGWVLGTTSLRKTSHSLQKTRQTCGLNVLERMKSCEVWRNRCSAFSIAVKLVETLRSLLPLELWLFKQLKKGEYRKNYEEAFWHKLWSQEDDKKSKSQIGSLEDYQNTWKFVENRWVTLQFVIQQNLGFLFHDKLWILWNHEKKTF